MESWPAVHDDCGVVAGHRAADGGGAGLPAVGRVVTPCDRSRNRIAVRGTRRGEEYDVAAWAIAGQAPEIFRNSVWALALAGSGESWSAGRSWVVARPRPPVARARLEGVEVPARGQSSAVAAGCDSVGPGPGGVVCPGWWPCSVDWHASAASAGRRAGRPGYSSVPGAVGAGTRVHSL